MGVAEHHEPVQRVIKCVTCRLTGRASGSEYGDDASFTSEPYKHMQTSGELDDDDAAERERKANSLRSSHRPTWLIAAVMAVCCHITAHVQS